MSHSEKEVWSSIRAIAGDRNIPGRLYATASGRGFRVIQYRSESMEETEPPAAIELVINTGPANENVPVVEIEPADESNLIDAKVSVNEDTLPDEMEQGNVVGTKGGGSLGWSLLSLLAHLTTRLFRIQVMHRYH